jgi:hypothetical protein
MQKSLFEENGITCLETFDGEEVSKSKGGININPSPREWICQCCGRPESELTPFGKAGDPLVGDFDGALLLKAYRSSWPFTFEEAEKIHEAFCDGLDGEGFVGEKILEEAYRRLTENFGTEDAGFIARASGIYSCIGTVLLCRDCIVLDYDEYFEKMGCNLGETELEMEARAKALYEKFTQMDHKRGSKRG